MKCPFVERTCSHECVAFNAENNIQCMVLQRADRTTMLLNFIEKKIDRIIESTN